MTEVTGKKLLDPRHILKIKECHVISFLQLSVLVPKMVLKKRAVSLLLLVSCLLSGENESRKSANIS